MAFVVTDACTLPTSARPLRLAEFDELFSTAVRSVDRLDATHARLRLSGPMGLASGVRDLTARETQCCSFFTFTVTAEPAEDGEAVVLDVAVPPRYADVLASLTARAAS
jgi:hypothetical protein